MLYTGVPVGLNPIIPCPDDHIQALSDKNFLVTVETVVFVMLPLASKPVTISVRLPHNVARYHLMKLFPSACITLKSALNPVISGLVIHVDLEILVK